MSVAGRVALYSLVILVAALAGALIPLYAQREKRMVTFLAFAAGVMLGAAFFHMVPEAFHGGGYGVFTLVPVGFLVLFLLERYVLVHACEEPPDCAEHAHHPAMGLTAFLGMSVHTLFDGVALGASVVEGIGFTAVLAITAHKLPSSLSLASILKAEGRSRPAVLMYIAVLALMVPLGAGLQFLVASAFDMEALAARALAFSAGTFLYVAVSDLLPHVNRHGKEGRLRNIIGLTTGLATMFVLAQVIGHPHG